MTRITWQHRRFYRFWNEECAAWATYKAVAGWF
jgi:hypothetical protein